MTQKVPISALAFSLSFSARPSQEFPGACEIVFNDRLAARVSAPAGPAIYQKALALRASPGGKAAETAYLVGVIDGLMAKTPTVAHLE